LNRVGDTYFDQCRWSGHADRLEDLDLLAGLGIRKLRYPVLWEKHAPESLDRVDFAWADERLARLRELGIAPIVGLVHHGSGPRYTGLADPEFPQKLACYARIVAERYPWLRDFTPVNEPLTTARFSGLYGHWYPHGRDERTFVRCLLNQVKGVILAMLEIRKVIPDARLVQTEDLAKIHATPGMAYQADFENERRWVSLDLLTGTLSPARRMYKHLVHVAGVDRRELDWFLDNACPPDVVGTNYYVTSERFLDERVDAYPAHAHATNGRQMYADVAACHVRGEGAAGLEVLLRECWQRYHLPIAVTEAHLGCTREEQVRWLGEIWEGAQGALRSGVDVRAVTAWCAFGAHNWNTLVTRDEGYYEPGLFDVRAPKPRPTALAHLCKQLARRGRAEHPVMDSAGWWRRSARLIFPVTYSHPDRRLAAIPPGYHGVRGGGGIERPILITGGGGTLAQALLRACRMRGLAHVALERDALDITYPDMIGRVLERHAPWAVINTAGMTSVDLAERDPEACRLTNAVGPAALAEACAAGGVRLVTFSTDLVFNGVQGGGSGKPYVETDPVQPLNEYGRSKAGAECLVLGALPSALVIRTGPFFGPWDGANFVARALADVAAGRPVRAAIDQVVSPTYVPDLAAATLDLLVDGANGLWHVANAGAIDWATFAERAVRRAGYDPLMVHGITTEDLGLAAPRPRYSALASIRHTLMPSLDDALERFFREVEADGGFRTRPCGDEGRAAVA
jgi:dTDP-4-dehydrorhamnose reductase